MRFVDEAPWIDDAQVEQDLVSSRALVEIFRRPGLADSQEPLESQLHAEP